eukprot:TRINITY_DN24_c0_g1_i6.p1 TRINITY_DN24_c0_g1~~TRINITY_DN24_c0_g1_i6.p1  ORF type:complete len:129 (+),score=39.02 TRINITY_DN24_c0_g1_i6:305-691(+)
MDPYASGVTLEQFNVPHLSNVGSMTLNSATLTAIDMPELRQCLAGFGAKGTAIASLNMPLLSIVNGQISLANNAKLTDITSLAHSSLSIVGNFYAPGCTSLCCSQFATVQQVASVSGVVTTTGCKSDC